MSAISVHYGKGGAGIGDGSPAAPQIATVLREVADDLAGVKPQAIAAAASAATAVADAAVITGGESPTEAEHNEVVNLANDLKAKYNAMVTLVNEIRTDLNAVNGYTVKTTKA